MTKVTITLLIFLIVLSACSTARITPEQASYFKELTEKEYSNVFDRSEMGSVWKRAKEFWKSYLPVERVSINKFKTHESVKTEITYVILRTPLPDGKYRVKITANLRNPLMSDTAKRNTAIFNEYINTGILKYPKVVSY
ncbi:hypothetical protein MNBD_GAMMA11-1797 [hydrothermal vent metagenome]|uniref:Lipoprotein n=1 Tax=hydrothermal vent metagenome TaxID=652676 RepID=A0A3B0XC17_9ZZZZ